MKSVESVESVESKDILAMDLFKNKNFIDMIQKAHKPIFTHNNSFNVSNCDSFFTSRLDGSSMSEPIDSSNFRTRVIPLSLVQNQNCEYVLDTLSVCNLFNSHAIKLTSIIFSDEMTELDYIKVISDGYEKNSIAGDFYQVLNDMNLFAAIERSKGKSVFSCPFFSTDHNLLIKSNTQIIFKLKHDTSDKSFQMHHQISYTNPDTPKPPRAKLILVVYNFKNVLKSISNVTHFLNFKNNYANYYIPHELVKKRHSIKLPFSGKLECIVILLQPFNKNTRLELTGKLEDGGNTMGILSPQINKINFMEYCRFKNSEKYNSNVVVVPFSVRTNESNFLDEGYYELQSDNLLFEFELANVTPSEDPGSVFVQVYSMFVDKYVFSLEHLGYEIMEYPPQFNGFGQAHGMGIEYIY